MKILKILLLAIVVVFASCKNEKVKKEENKIEKQQVSYLYFGDTINDIGVITKNEMAAKYKSIKAGDTLDLKFATSINEVCKTKGCWMNVDLGDDSNDAFVKFKDYGFFMPMNSENREIIVNGKAFVTTTSVEELRHFAEDAGKSKEEIEKINEPKRTLGFVSDGVLMVNNEK